MERDNEIASSLQRRNLGSCADCRAGNFRRLSQGKRSGRETLFCRGVARRSRNNKDIAKAIESCDFHTLIFGPISPACFLLGVQRSLQLGGDGAVSSADNTAGARRSGPIETLLFSRGKFIAPPRPALYAPSM